jgi:hypothetical protein
MAEQFDWSDNLTDFYFGGVPFESRPQQYLLGFLLVLRRRVTHENIGLWFQLLTAFLNEPQISSYIHIWK